MTASAVRWILFLAVVMPSLAASDEIPLAPPGYTEEQVKQQFQPEACVNPARWVRVRYGNMFLEVRCQHPEAPPPKVKRPAPKKPPQGFQRTRWGMHKSEVMRQYPGLRGRKNVLWFASTVSGCPAVTSFHFHDNALVRVVVAFRPRGGESAETDCFDSARDALIETYGSPLPEGSGNSWATGPTRVELTLDTSAVVNRLKATYSSQDATDQDDDDEKDDQGTRGGSTP